MKKLLIIIAIVSCLGAFASPEPRKQSLRIKYSAGANDSASASRPMRTPDYPIPRDTIRTNTRISVFYCNIDSLVCYLEKKQPIAHASQSCVCVTKGSVNAFFYSELVQMKPIPRLCPSCFDDALRVAVDSVSLRVKRAQK